MKNIGEKMIGRLIAVSLIVSLALPSIVRAVTYDELIVVKQNSHKIAEKARESGLPDNHDIIANAKEVWFGADKAIENEEYDMYMFYSENDVDMLAKLMYGEGRGINSKTELACIVWTVLNRYDAGYGHIRNIITAKNQYHYSKGFATVSDCGYDLKELARDVLNRWNKEKNNIPSDGRVLPKEYLNFTGDGEKNIFRNKSSVRWNFSLPSPYEN